MNSLITRPQLLETGSFDQFIFYLRVILTLRLMFPSARSYYNFIPTFLTQNIDLQKTDAHEEVDEFDDDMAMDPYSDYHAPSKAERSDRPARPQLSPDHTKDFTNGDVKNGHHEDGIVRIDEREDPFRSFVRNDDRPNHTPFGIQTLNDTVEPEPIAKGKFGKGRHEKTRRKRNASDEFLKELSNVSHKKKKRL